MKFLFFALLPLISFAQNHHELLMEGDKAFQMGEYGKAEEFYRKAANFDKTSSKANYNQGLAIYKQAETEVNPSVKKGRYEEAARKFQNAANLTNSNTDKAKALYNLGNAKLWGSDPTKDNPSEETMKLLEESVKNYKNALKLNPGDKQIAHNLSFATKRLNKMKQQQEQQKQDEQKDEQEKDKKDEKENQKQDKQESPSQKKANEDMLQKIEQEEKKVQEKMNKAKAKASAKNGKEW